MKTLYKLAPGKKGIPLVSIGHWIDRECDILGALRGQDCVITHRGKKHIMFKNKVFSTTPLLWYIVAINGENAVLLCNSIVDINEPDQATDDWLESTFKKIAFSDINPEMIKGDARLLYESEYNEISDKSILAYPPAIGCGDLLYWWIDAKTFGNKQKVVKVEDGTLYSNGLARNKALGIRPVIEIDYNTLINYLEA